MESERIFQANLIKKLKDIFPGCIVLKNDPNYLQGFPDLLVLYGEHWAALECKRFKTAPRRPNQEYYIDILGSMSYAAFVYPENEEEVLNDIQQALRPYGEARVP